MKDTTSRSAALVAAGILLSRITGFVRDLTIAIFLGTTPVVDAYVAALRIPNVLRNLLGEGTLSASFVPVYSSILAQGERARGDARRLAGGVLGAVVALAALLAALGVLVAPILTRVVAPGFGSEQAALTTHLVRILFPMAGVMILAAWCLGVLNSHRRFFLPFVAPTVWNLAQVAGLLIGSRLGWAPLIHVLAWSTLAGSVLQLAIQLPLTRRLAGSLRPRLDRRWEPVRRVVRNAGPVAAGQGVFQFSSFVDVVLASTLPGSALAGLYFAQRIALLPLSLFGVSVATAALPEMSRESDAEALRLRLVGGFLRILFFVLPSAVILFLFGDLVVRLLFQHGVFDATSTALVSSILAAYAAGLVASSSIKLFAGGYHARQDTVTPMRFAVAAVALGVAIGAGIMLWLRARGFGPTSVVGLAIGGSAGAWLNLALLWRGLHRRLGRLFEPADWRAVGRLAAAAAAAAGAGVLARGLLEPTIGGNGLLPTAALLAGTLVAGSVPYLLIARRPPTAGLRPPPPE